MKAQTKPCYLCDGGHLRAARSSFDTTLDGVAYTHTLNAEECNACGEVFTQAIDHQHAEREIAHTLLHTRAGGAQAFRFLRLLSVEPEAQKFAAAIGVSPETLSRWENGKKSIHEATFELLRMLAAKRLGVTYQPEGLQATRLPSLRRTPARVYGALLRRASKAPAARHGTASAR